MTAQELTPSSFTVSPILTPAPSLQYDATNSSLNIRHMELFSNFMLETMPGLDMNGIVDLGLMRTVMPAILSTPYLLLQVPALSALHLSHTKPMQGISYHADATSLQIEALTSFDEHLGNINSENCDTILMFASLLGTHSLAEAVMTSNSDADGFLDRFVTYLNLHRGVQTVTSQAWALLLQSKISPVLHHASTQLSLAASHTPEQAVLVTEQLSRLLDDGEMSPESNTACRDAVSRLKLMYQADYLEVQCPETKQRPSGLLSAWPVLLSAVYTDLLQKRQPEALIILCYYAVLLHQRRSVWFVGDSGRMLVVSITKSLGSYWRHWLDWPNQVTGDPLVS
ncbi:uncharacterized protein EKO05_0005987 [Ascochyta rabiei]|uniref:Uncharacterized protein n=1 Tax=Didymella rabiei TaxID=5454 RepID=A0A163MAG1_DIDRA|nr:uncharacterized protein EKO05_0005987 [Ascochyta rabiei]KZM28541.1 hypothetical protein ST47_g353 [Ascochyta rabiei]UPX15543.1 hypothetical protein EKO05_0005987 [Ascochyta rabiei]